MANAAGLFKVVTYKKETTFGTLPTAASGQILRRVTSDLNLNKDTYTSNEIRPEQQKADFRHGVRRVAGSVNADLSPRTFSDFIGSICKRLFAIVAALTGLSITVAAGSVVNGIQQWRITRSAGSFLSDNIKVGMVVRLTAGTFNALNLNKNLWVVAVTATVLTVVVMNRSVLFAEGPIASATLSVPGRVTFIPSTGHIEESYSIEHWFPDVPSSETFTGCKVTSIDISLPPTGIAALTASFIGQNMTPQATQYFATTPLAATSTGSLAAVNGYLRAGGVIVGVLTGLTIKVDAQYTGDPVVGSDVVPQFYPGMINVNGQATAFFDNATLRDVFLNETEIDIVGAFTTDNSAAADFVVLAMPRVKLLGHSKSDGEGAVIATMDFQSLLNVNGGTGVATERTSFWVQDSQAT